MYSVIKSIHGRLLQLMLCAVLLVPLAAGCASDQAIIAQAANMHSQLEPAVVEDPVLNEYMERVGQRIQDVAQEMSRQGYAPKAHKQGEDVNWMFGPDIGFHLVNSKTLNAFTTGGKHAYMYTQLMQSCKTEDEFAAVVAHEYAHIYCRHVHNGMNRQYAILGTAALAGGAGYLLGGENKETFAAGAAGLALVGGQFVGMGFGRKDEDEADKYGFAFYARAGWDPNQFGNFFQTMIDKGYDKTPEMMSSHPALRNRVENARRRTRELPPQAEQWRRPPIASPSQFKELQARAARVGKNMPNDESLQKAQLMLAAFPSCVAPVAQPEQKAAKEELLRDLEKGHTRDAKQKVQQTKKTS